MERMAAVVEQINVFLPFGVHAFLVLAASIGFAAIWNFAGRVFSQAKDTSESQQISQACLQFSFGAKRLRKLYQKMDIQQYILSQKVDFLIVGGIAVLGCVAGSFAMRLAPVETWAATLGLWSIAFALLGAAFDGAEDLVSFVTLKDVQGFPDWLAFFYSLLASLKLVFLVLWLSALFGSLGITVQGALWPGSG